MAAQPKISRLVPVTALLLLALFASPVGAESGTEPSLPQMPKQPPDRNNSRSLISPGRHRPRSFWPRTGDTVASIRRIAETLKSHGYSVDLINVDASEDEAARRLVRRFLEIGRMLRARFLKESREHAHNRSPKVGLPPNPGPKENKSQNAMITHPAESGLERIKRAASAR